MNPHAQRAIDLVLSIHGGDPWHGYATMRVLEGVTAAGAAAHPAPGVHSIWELVLHLTAWTGEVGARLAGADAKDPREGDWPGVGDPTEERWRAAVQALDGAQRDLAAMVAKVPDGRWDARVGDTREPGLGTGVTHLETLEGLAAHHAYHSGQIALLKRWEEGKS
jgi:uncharacterized damage-inducible protein DinB